MTRAGECPREHHLVVLRFGRLGDLVMTLPALRWALGTPGLRVTLVTDSHYRPLFEQGFEGLEVATTVPRCDLVLDLHRVARSRRARRGHSWLGVAKEDVRRRLQVLGPSFGASFGPKKTWPERHLDAMERALGRLGLREHAGAPPSARPSLPRRAEPRSNRLGLVLGAGHATKQWPTAHFEELAAGWRGEVLALLGPGEEHLAEAAGLRPPPDRSLAALIEQLSSCSVVVAGDTGPLHVAAALGCRVVALFGPTPVASGFWVWDGEGSALSTSALSCRPCHLHGQAECPERHHRCMNELSVARVREALDLLRARPS